MENLQLLQDAGSGVSVAIVQSGVADEKAASDLQALGSLYREPLWVFYRGEATIERLSQLAGKRIGVGPTASGTYPIAVKLLAANGLPDAGKRPRKEDGPGHAGQRSPTPPTALQKGELDAAFFVAAFDTPYIQQLLNDDKVHLLSFGQQEAYHRRYPFPVRPDRAGGPGQPGTKPPRQGRSLLAPTAMLVVRKDLHPALIPLLLSVATRIHGQGDELSNPGEFPSDFLHRHTRQRGRRDVLQVRPARVAASTSPSGWPRWSIGSRSC